MIEWGSRENRQQVQCLTRLDDQQIEVRLSKRRTGGLPDKVILDEPSALEYARLRKAALAADAEINDKYSEPQRPPDRVPGETDVERMLRISEYNKAAAAWVDDRHNYRTDEDFAPYAGVVVQAVNMLAVPALPVEVTLGDLPPEAFKAQVLQALLETWETPLGGPVSPVVVPTMAPATGPLDEPTPEATPEADSPESPRSSPPGGEPSPPSPPPSSTE